MRRFARGTAGIFILFVLLVARVSAAQPWYRVWAANGAGDQSADPVPQNSGLVGWRGGADNVMDTDLAPMAMPANMRGTDIMWVFGQCFGGGMFDELNGLPGPGKQAGVSASTYNQTAHYPLPAAQGGVLEDFITAYIRGMSAVNPPKAIDLADYAAANDPWANNPAPVPARGAERRGAEQPWYFTMGAGANNLTPDSNNKGIVILWSGQPRRPYDPDQLSSVISVLVDPLGPYKYTRDRVYVYYHNGMKGGGNPIVANHIIGQRPKVSFRAATKAQLQMLFTAAFGRGKPNPPFVFFLANDHGFNTAMGGAVPKDWDDQPTPYPDDEEGDYGDGDYPRPPTVGLTCDSVTPCKLTRPGTGCEAQDCPAFRMNVSMAQTVTVTADGSSGPQCTGDPLFDASGDVTFPTEGDYIVYLPLDVCPAGAPYSVNWSVGDCIPACGNFTCADPMPDCDLLGAESLPAIDLNGAK